MNDCNYKAELRNFISNNFMYGSKPEDLGDDTSLLESGIIDSTGILEIIDFLEETFDFSIENDEVTPDNLDSINRIYDFILKKK